MEVKSESEVAQSCPSLSDIMDCSLPGSSVHGIFQARVLEWGAIAFSGFPGSSADKESACNTGDLSSIPGSEDPLEKGLAIHSSILVWRIPWMEEPGRLQSMGSLRAGHD